MNEGKKPQQKLLQSWAQEGVAEDQLWLGMSSKGSKCAHPIANLPESSSWPGWPSGKPHCRALPPLLRDFQTKSLPRCLELCGCRIQSSVGAPWQLSFNHFLLWSQLPLPDVLSHGVKKRSLSFLLQVHWASPEGGSEEEMWRAVPGKWELCWHWTARLSPRDQLGHQGHHLRLRDLQILPCNSPLTKQTPFACSQGTQSPRSRALCPFVTLNATAHSGILLCRNSGHHHLPDYSKRYNPKPQVLCQGLVSKINQPTTHSSAEICKSLATNQIFFFPPSF